ncbi:MAG: hypothetical protein H6985_06280 [Pseudomonadales bacterium]|nr:hypothetical protein [Pseudomonadales bacterium]
MLWLPLTFIAVPLAIYVFLACRNGGKRITSEEFYESRGIISPAEFANSSTAYGFQIASVSVFFAFGYFYGIGGIVNPIFWGLGILFFIMAVPRIADFFGTTQTLHGFLGDRYKSSSMTCAASVMTLIGFLGAFTAELVWGSYVLSIISGCPGFINLSVVIMACLVAFYVTRAGHLSVIKTDQYQVVIAYAAFVVLVVFLISLFRGKGAEAQSIGFLLSAVTAVLLLLVAFGISRQIWGNEAHADIGLGRTISFILLLVVIGGCILSGLNAINFYPALSMLDQALSDTRLYDFNQGTLNLMSLALLPLFWQFADVTMWQRLGATRIPSADHANRYSQLRTGLLRYAIETPVSWILAIIAGIALRYVDIGLTDESIWNGIAEIPLSIIGAETHFGSLLNYIVASLFAAGIVAAMLSTADSFLIASTFTLAYDLAPRLSKSEMKSKDAWIPSLRFGQVATVLFVLVALIAYWIATFFELDILTILFGAFGAQVSLFPSVAGSVFLGNRTPTWRWALASVVLGFLSGLVVTIVAVNNQEWALYPPLAAIAGSAIIYLLGTFIVGARKVIK